MARHILIVIILALLTACATYPANEAINKINPNDGYRFDSLAPKDNSESLFVILAFSGGGTRAAALSYGLMEKLRSTTIRWKNKDKRLLDEVDVISSVSGGSFTAAYYGLFRDQLFDKSGGFLDQFLYRDIEGELFKELFKPSNFFRLASPTFGRIDLASEFYSQTLFEKKTYADLQKNGRPFLIVNSTDMSKGSVFSFVQSQFDYICSDLLSFPVARAVAASSNFPIAFTPLQINNYATQCDYEKPGWIKQAEMDEDFSINPRRNARARTVWSYRNSNKRPYIHLLDGGVSDNIGLRGPMTALISNDSPWSIPNKINKKVIEKIVVIVVDAKTRPSVDYDEKASPPGLFSILESISTIPLDNYSFDTIELLRRTFKDWKKNQRLLWNTREKVFTHCPGKPDNIDPYGRKPIDLYAIYVGFDQISDGEKISGKDRNWFLQLPTSFSLPANDVDIIRDAGRMLLEKSASFQELVNCLR